MVLEIHSSGWVPLHFFGRLAIFFAVDFRRFTHFKRVAGWPLQPKLMFLSLLHAKVQARIPCVYFVAASALACN